MAFRAITYSFLSFLFAYARARVRAYARTRERALDVVDRPGHGVAVTKVERAAASADETTTAGPKAAGDEAAGLMQLRNQKAAEAAGMQSGTICGKKKRENKFNGN